MGANVNGLNPLSYGGVQATTPPQLLYIKRAPTPNDNSNVKIGTLWLYTNYPLTPTVYELFMLVSLAGGIANWTPIFPVGGSGGGASEFPTDVGTANELAGVLDIVGDSNITTRGSGNTVQATLNSTIVLSGSLTTGTGITNSANGITNTGGLTSSGITTLSALGKGLVRSNVSGVLSVIPDGTSGQVLIGVTAGNPIWNALTAGSGIALTPGAGTLTISTSGSGAGGGESFMAYVTTTYSITAAQVGVNGSVFYYMPHVNYPTVLIDQTGGYNSGTSIFTAPVNGLYSFSAVIGNSTITNSGAAPTSGVSIVPRFRIIPVSGNAFLWGLPPISGAYAFNLSENANSCISAIVQMNAGDQLDVVGFFTVVSAGDPGTVTFNVLQIQPPPTVVLGVPNSWPAIWYRSFFTGTLINTF